MREMSECPAALVTMLISVRGFGSVTNKLVKLYWTVAPNRNRT